MDKDQAATTREERLAARLRENLKRRKAQARALSGSEPPPRPDAGAPGSALPKPPRKS